MNRDYTKLIAWLVIGGMTLVVWGITYSLVS